MDIAALIQGIGFVKSAIETIKQAKDLLPAGRQKDDIETVLASAERELRIAEAKLADELNYQLCRNHFPPEIMLSSDQNLWVCPKCGNQRKTEWGVW